MDRGEAGLADVGVRGGVLEADESGDGVPELGVLGMTIGGGTLNFPLERMLSTMSLKLSCGWAIAAFAMRF